MEKIDVIEFLGVFGGFFGTEQAAVIIHDDAAAVRLARGVSVDGYHLAGEFGFIFSHDFDRLPCHPAVKRAHNDVGQNGKLKGVDIPRAQFLTPPR